MAVYWAPSGDAEAAMQRARAVGGLNRRTFVQSMGAVGLGLVVGCGRLPFQAAPPRVPRIGLLDLGFGSNPDDSESASPAAEDFRRGLREFGYVDGQNVVVELRYADGRLDRLDALAAELVRLPVDVLVVVGPPSARAAAAATSTTPIVALIANPVGVGMAASYPRPGGNVTGIDQMWELLNGKRLELLRDAGPGIARVGVLWTPGLPGREGEYDELSGPAGVLGLELQSLAVRASGDLDGAFAAARAAGVEALLTLDSGLLTPSAGRIAELALQHRLPWMAINRRYVAAGALMAYGANGPAMRRRGAGYVDKLLKGANPAELPVEQPREFDFVINLRTAQAIGLTIPQHVLLQATEVIQ